LSMISFVCIMKISKNLKRFNFRKISLKLKFFLSFAKTAGIFFFLIQKNLNHYKKEFCFIKIKKLINFRLIENIAHEVFCRQESNSSKNLILCKVFKKFRQNFTMNARKQNIELYPKKNENFKKNSQTSLNSWKITILV